MSELAIRVENLSKRYRIGKARQRHDTLRDALMDGLSSLPQRLRHGNSRDGEGEDTFWALKDVSFDVKRGEVVGIIGRNGAGKSTLLKILSRITEPTEGRAEIHGRVGSLLEVGTGFHPELTGRENIYLSGAILGMHRTEIARRFDEIVEFSGVEKFLDTPIKRYSSGMNVRLGFAVAAHLEPEILLVDEVLAVGDAAFQKKCLGKMGEVAGQGRTVLFVSHNMAAVQSLCSQSILLEAGRVSGYADTASIVGRYLCPPESGTSSVDLSISSGHGRGKAHIIKRFTIMDDLGRPTSSFKMGSAMCLQITLKPPYQLLRPVAGVGMNTSHGVRVFTLATYFANLTIPSIPADRRVDLICNIPSLPLSPGIYSIQLSAGEAQEGLLDEVHDALWFSVEATDYFGTGAVPSQTQGAVIVHSEWHMEDNGHAWEGTQDT